MLAPVSLHSLTTRLPSVFDAAGQSLANVSRESNSANGFPAADLAKAVVTSKEQTSALVQVARSADEMLQGLLHQPRR